MPDISETIEHQHYSTEHARQTRNPTVSPHNRVCRRVHTDMLDYSGQESDSLSPQSHNTGSGEGSIQATHGEGVWNLTRLVLCSGIQ